jgi:hypothetical protein
MVKLLINLFNLFMLFLASLFLFYEYLFFKQSRLYINFTFFDSLNFLNNYSRSFLLLLSILFFVAFLINLIIIYFKIDVYFIYNVVKGFFVVSGLSIFMFYFELLRNINEISKNDVLFNCNLFTIKILYTYEEKKQLFFSKFNELIDSNNLLNASEKLLIKTEGFNEVFSSLSKDYIELLPLNDLFILVSEYVDDFVLGIIQAKYIPDIPPEPSVTQWLVPIVCCVALFGLIIFFKKFDPSMVFCNELSHDVGNITRQLRTISNELYNINNQLGNDQVANVLVGLNNIKNLLLDFSTKIYNLSLF